MKIAIHRNPNSFYEPWKAYCEERSIAYKVVNCYDSDIVAQVEDCDVVLFHHNHASPKDVLFAKQLLFALEQSGKLVFPDYYSNWHFDDKVAQKYLLESLHIPCVATHVYYDKESALRWLESTVFPKVFKLRRGAGSRNVWLVKSKLEAKGLVKRAFSSGFRQYDALGGIKESVRKFLLKKASIKDILKSVAHIVYPIQLEKAQGRERGYVYFQDFIPANSFDIRVIVIGEKAIAIKRHVRKNDFRASGSGFIEYDKSLFETSLIEHSFAYAAKLKASCVAFDFVFNQKEPLVVEISFGFSYKAYYQCPGYWTRDLQWHEAPVNPCGWMIDTVIEKYNLQLK